MKKLFIVGLVMLMSVALAGNVMANGYGSQLTVGTGNLGVVATAVGGALDIDGNKYPNGGAFGITGAGGSARAGATGFIMNGMVEAEVTAIGGGLTNNFNTIEITNIRNGKKLTLGSYGFGLDNRGNLIPNQATAGATIKVKVDPDQLIAFGDVGGLISGAAAQGSLNITYLTDGPKLIAEGFTGGMAVQGGMGWFLGGVNAGSLGDTPEFRIFCFRIPGIDSKAGAGAGAQIDIIGISYSESFRQFTEKKGVRTEAMGTFVGAETNVISSGYDYNWDKGLAIADSFIMGGWKAGGSVASYTKIGGAKAGAFGSYQGSGGLNKNYVGSAVGYTQGSVTTVSGMQGSIVSSSAGMSVTSSVTNNNNN